MSVFIDDPEEWQRFDFGLLQNSSVPICRRFEDSVRGT